MAGAVKRPTYTPRALEARGVGIKGIARRKREANTSRYNSPEVLLWQADVVLWGMALRPFNP